MQETTAMTTGQQPNASLALVPIRLEPPRTVLPTQAELSVIWDIAQSVVATRGHAVPMSIDSPAKAAAVMLAGHELGVKPMTALRHIFVVNGRTEPDAQIMAGILAAREPDAQLEIIELTAERCTMRISRPSRGVRAEYTYELADAERAGLLKNDNWRKYPKDMLRWAATKRLCRAYAPDLVNSVAAYAPAAPLLAEPAEEAIEAFTERGPIPAALLYNPGDEDEDDLATDEGTSYADPVTGEITEPAEAAPQWTEAARQPEPAGDVPPHESALERTQRAEAQVDPHRRGRREPVPPQARSEPPHEGGDDLTSFMNWALKTHGLGSPQVCEMLHIASPSEIGDFAFAKTTIEAKLAAGAPA